MYIHVSFLSIQNVDKKKLEKAEAKLKSKLEKRSQKDDAPKQNG